MIHALVKAPSRLPASGQGRVTGCAHVESARKELATHHAYAIRHVGKWMGETLSDAPDGAR